MMDEKTGFDLNDDQPSPEKVTTIDRTKLIWNTFYVTCFDEIRLLEISNMHNVFCECTKLSCQRNLTADQENI